MSLFCGVDWLQKKERNPLTIKQLLSHCSQDLIWSQTDQEWCLLLVAFQLLNRELREAKSAKMEKMKTNVAPEAEASSQQPSAQNHLPQSPLDTPASAQTASSSSPAAPAAQAAPSAPSPPAKLHLGRDKKQKQQKPTCCSKTAVVCSFGGRVEKKKSADSFSFSVNVFALLLCCRLVPRRAGIT